MPTIIVGHDGTQRGDDALALARLLSRGPNVRRVIAYVAADNDAGSDVEAAHPAALDALELGADEELRVLRAGSAGRRLQELVEDPGVSLLVLGPSRHGSQGRALGTTVERMMNGSPCPVAAAVPGLAAAEGLRRLLVAYDGSLESDAALALAAQVVRGTDALVDVVTVRAPLPEAERPGSGGFGPFASRSASREAQAVADAALAKLPDGHRGTARVGDPPAGRAIVAEALRADADLVVMGSRGYGPMRRVLLGTTGSAVAHATPCSLLVIPRHGG